MSFLTDLLNSALIICVLVLAVTCFLVANVMVRSVEYSTLGVIWFAVLGVLCATTGVVRLAQMFSLEERQWRTFEREMAEAKKK